MNQARPRHRGQKLRVPRHVKEQLQESIHAALVSAERCRAMLETNEVDAQVARRSLFKLQEAVDLLEVAVDHYVHAPGIRLVG